MSARTPSLLLVEPQFLLRRTVASVARELRLANVHEATSIEAGGRLAGSTAFDALLLDLDAEGAAIELIAQLRRGDLRCRAATPVAVLAGACNTDTVLRLKQLDVRRVVLKPFKVKGVLEAISGLCQPLPAAPAAVNA